MDSTTAVNLSIPRQNLHKFGLFELDAQAAETWAKELPVTNTRSVVQQLRHALSDLNHVKLPAQLRYDIMEALRPKLDVALANLSKRFLNQPLVMPEEPRQMAEVADSLYSMIRTAYTIVAIQAVEQRDAAGETNPARLTGEAIQRALLYAGRKILQSYQLYNPIEMRGWQTVHQLYVLAQDEGLDQLPVSDPLGGGATVTAAYLQVVLLGCGKPNQMRQNDLAAFYRGLKGWSEYVSIEDSASKKGLFLVDLESDQAPLYAWLYNEEPNDHCRLIDTKGLTEHLEQLKSTVGKEGIVFDKDITMPGNILDHLIASLSIMSLRNFNRTRTSDSLAVCFGLSSTHYHISGERVFEQMLYGDDYIPPAVDPALANPFLHASDAADAVEDTDVAAESEAATVAAEQAALEEEMLAQLAQEDAQLPPEERYPILRVPLADASPGGYCLELTDAIPGDIKTGDIAGLKEQQNKDWMIAVIRWVSHSEDEKTFIGLELLSPRAMPYGARILRKTGQQSAPLRVLLLPEIKLVGQPHTLITPRAGFRERQKITLLSRGEEFYIQLQRQVATTGSFSQYDFRYIKNLEDILEEDKSRAPEAAYDSMWNNI